MDIYHNAVKIGEGLVKNNYLNSELDVCLVLSSQNKTLLIEKLNHNDLKSHLKFISKIMDFLYMENTVITFFAHCNNCDDLHAKFSVYWFLKYFFTSIESNTEIIMCVIYNSKVLAIKSNGNIPSEINDHKSESFINSIISSQYMSETYNLSNQIDKQDISCFRWIDYLKV